MRKTLLIIAAFMLLLTSCKKNETVSFCEGKTPEGKGVKCGRVFTTGDVMVLVRAEGPFTVNRLKLDIFEKAMGGKKKLRATRYREVKPEDQSASMLVPLYSEGTFLVVASAGKKEVGRNSVEIRLH